MAKQQKHQKLGCEPQLAFHVIQLYLIVTHVYKRSIGSKSSRLADPHNTTVPVIVAYVRPSTSNHIINPK